MTTSMAAHREREVKLEATLDLALPDLRGLVGGTFRLPEEDLHAAYFDTPDFRLWERRVTLRHRSGEGPGDGVWTLKLPGGTGPRGLDRTELTWAGPRDEPPAEARRILRGLVRNADLRQVVELRTLRRPLELHDESGHPWAVLDDDTVTVSGGPRDGLRFREVEVELADEDGDHDVEALDTVVRALRKAGARRHDDPKFATALGLASAEPPSDGRLRKRSELEAVVRHSLRAGLDRLLEHDVRLRVDRTRPPATDIHQARVATRRLRSDLKTFEPVLDEVWTRRMRADLKWVGAALGAVRDLDVLASTVEGPADRPPIDAAGCRELRGRLAEQRLAAAHQVVEVIEEDSRYLRMLDRLHAASDAPPFRAGRGPGRSGRRTPKPDDPARDQLPQLVRPSWRALRRRVRRAGPHPNARELHRIRIKAKQLRYAAEAAEPVIGKPARRTAKAAAHIQSVLGDHHDTVAAEEWLWNEALRSSPWGSFSAGQLTAEMRERQRRLRRRWRADWSKLDRTRAHAWLE
jgi:CHAD domain-containing protein